MKAKYIIFLLLWWCPLFSILLSSQEDKTTTDSVFIRLYLDFYADGKIYRQHEKPNRSVGQGTVYYDQQNNLRRYELDLHFQDSTHYVDAYYNNKGDLTTIYFNINEKGKPRLLGSISKDESRKKPILLNYEIKSTDSLQSGLVIKAQTSYPKRILHWDFQKYVHVNNLWDGSGLKPMDFSQRVKFRQVRVKEWVHITANGVSIREAPNTTSRVREAWSTGHRFYVEEVMQTDSIAPWGTYPWYKVRWEGNQSQEYGYVFGAFVTQVDEEVPSRMIRSTSFRTDKGAFVNNARPGATVQYYVKTINIPDGDSIRFRMSTKEEELDYIIKVENNVATTPFFEVKEKWLGSVLRPHTTEVVSVED